MGERRHDEPRFLAEGYDHPQPAPRNGIVPVEPLATRDRVFLVVVRAGHGLDDHSDLIEKVPPSSLDEVAMGAFVEDNLAPVGVSRPRNRLVGHAAEASCEPLSARVNRSASSPAGRAWRYRSVVVIREWPIAALMLTKSMPPATSSEP